MVQTKDISAKKIVFQKDLVSITAIAAIIHRFSACHLSFMMESMKPLQNRLVHLDLNFHCFVYEK